MIDCLSVPLASIELMNPASYIIIHVLTLQGRMTLGITITRARTHSQAFVNILGGNLFSVTTYVCGRIKSKSSILIVVFFLGLLVPVATAGCSRDFISQHAPPSRAEPTLLPTKSPEQPVMSPTESLPRTPSSLPTEVTESKVPVEYDADAIYSRELYRGRRFRSPEQWTRKFDEWTDKRPKHPGLVAAAKGLAAAFRAGRAFGDDSQTQNDKWQHCVLGAEIGHSSSLEVASFAAWLKEFQDLTDGRTSTGFDEVDYEATVDGARQSISTKCENCAEVCAARWGRRDRVWNGNKP